MYSSGVYENIYAVKYPDIQENIEYKNQNLPERFIAIPHKAFYLNYALSLPSPFIIHIPYLWLDGADVKMSHSLLHITKQHTVYIITLTYQSRHFGRV